MLAKQGVQTFVIIISFSFNVLIEFIFPSKKYFGIFSNSSKRVLSTNGKFTQSTHLANGISHIEYNSVAAG
jgi:hypothetical protein